MRLSVASLRRVVKGDLTIQFVPQALTSYGGLELLQRYLRQIDVCTRLRQAFAGLRSDYGSARLALAVLALFYVGARRLEHLRYLGSDPLVTRFCGLARLPTRRTVANWLRQFTQETLAPLVALNRDLVTEALARLKLARLTIDVDGSVIRTGSTVRWAFRGFNPHHRKDPSYYPLFAHVAQTGHILQVKNRPGNVHDSKQAVPFLREIIDDLRGRFGRRVALEFRMDAAFFQQGIFRLLTARECFYAIKVGYWSWLPLKQVAAACRRKRVLVNVVDVPPLGKLEAIVTAGGLSTAPWSFLGKLTTYENKTLRYPGHWAQMIAFNDLGLFELDPIDVDGRRVVPRHVFHALFEPKVLPEKIVDVCVERVRALGQKDGAAAEAVVELVDRYDPATGFTSMERLTGWHAAIAAEMIAMGRIPPGAHPVELGIPARPFVVEARKRGINIEERVSPAA